MLVLCLSMVGLQLVIYLTLLAVGATKIRAASRLGESFLTVFYCVCCLYIALELVIQVSQLALILVNSQPEQNSNIVIALNGLCIMLDQLVLLLLTMYWAKIEGSFIGVIRYVEPAAAGVPYRLMPTLALATTYMGYLIYLITKGYLTT